MFSKLRDSTYSDSNSGVECSRTAQENRRIEVVVDTGSTYCWIPKGELRKIGILEHGNRPFKTIKGEKVERPFGYAWFSYDGASGGSEVEFADQMMELYWASRQWGEWA